MRVKKEKPDKELLLALKDGTLKRSKDADKQLQIAKQAAGNYLKKNARINIRLSEPDLILLKRKAAEKGMPYQTLISSLLHQVASGRILI